MTTYTRTPFAVNIIATQAGAIPTTAPNPHTSSHIALPREAARRLFDMAFDYEAFVLKDPMLRQLITDIEPLFAEAQR